MTLAPIPDGTPAAMAGDSLLPPPRLPERHAHVSTARPVALEVTRCHAAERTALSLRPAQMVDQQVGLRALPGKAGRDYLAVRRQVDALTSGGKPGRHRLQQRVNAETTAPAGQLQRRSLVTGALPCAYAVRDFAGGRARACDQRQRRPGLRLPRPRARAARHDYGPGSWRRGPSHRGR